MFSSIIHRIQFFRMSSTLKCRFYENEFPDVEDTVVANVLSIAEMGAYVNLSEYNNKGRHDCLQQVQVRPFSSILCKSGLSKLP